ncbi:MAG TPA: nucleotidyltransferase family protein [Ureibacillus sp.]|nr:nucleotidyltransferase family protein [Ureibacillus sp.]
MCKLGAIILAAGLSKRMGKPKLFLPYLNKPLIHYPISVAVEQKFSPLIVVGGKFTPQLQSELKEHLEQLSIISNPAYETGMSSSLKMGIRALNEEVDGVFIFLGDQPFVAAEVVERLSKVYKENRARGVKIVRPRYAHHPGHPILFDKSLFPQFEFLTGDEGGKRIIKANENCLIYVDIENSQLNLDIDTPQDYEALINQDTN